jgi:DNA repair exonuclease SbcCD ATPase subunit
MNQHLLSTFALENIVPLEPYQLGEALSQVSTGYHPEAVRNSGLNLTAGQHAQNLFFVSAGLRLPLTADEIKQMGWEREDLEGVKPTELAKLFSEIHSIASVYREHTNDLQRITNGYARFADEFDLWASLTIESGERILDRQRQGIELTPQDQFDKESMMDYLEAARDDTKSQLRLCVAVSDRLTAYQTNISAVNDRVDQSLDVIRKAEKGKNAEIDRLTQDLEILRQRRDDLLEEYRRLGRKLWTRGAAGGIIGMIVSGSIYGIRMTRVRRQINEVSGQKNAKAEQLERLSAAQSKLESVGGFLEDMSTNLSEAATAVTDLIGSWIELESFIAAAKNQLKSINNTTSLRALVVRLRQANNHWSNAGKLAEALRTVFLEGETIHRVLSQNGHTRVPIDHPSLDARLQAFMMAQKFLVGQHSLTSSES